MLNKLNLAENKAVLNSRFQTIGLLSYLGSMNKGNNEMCTINRIVEVW